MVIPCPTGVHYIVYLACTAEVANLFAEVGWVSHWRSLCRVLGVYCRGRKHFYTRTKREVLFFYIVGCVFTLLAVFLHSQESSATQSELVRLRRRSRRCVWHEKGDEAAPGCAENKCIRNGGRRAVFHFHERPRVPTAFDVRDAARFHFDDGRFPVCVGEVGEERAI